MIYFLLFLLLFLLVYTMVMIKREKKIYLLNPKEVNLGPWKLFVPLWWQISEESDLLVKFQRKNFKYQWECIFKRHFADDKNIENKKEELNHLIEFYKIRFDEPLEIQTREYAGITINLIEGMATKTDSEERAYIQMALIYSGTEIMFVKGKAPILYGMVEGPYFDEVLKNLRLLKP